MARRGEVISSALFAGGIHTFGTHHVDGSHQGIFCANGQCAQCLLLADGLPVKSCITPVKQGMEVTSLNGLPVLPADDSPVPPCEVTEFEIEVFIVGGGPAGLSAAIELGARGVPTIIADDKQELGGKLTLQTHNFFGSVAECYAGTRGFEIGELLAEEVESLDSVSVWLNSPVVGVFSDGRLGVVKDGIYRLVTPKRLLVTAGAREKALAFPGCDLPGVYGAGAFQTLVNRDGVRCADRVLIVGGGNVGLIVAYHALQAGIDVVAVVEALPWCGGYRVHLDKIKRLGVPVYTSHTVLRAEGEGHLERVIIGGIDEHFQPLPGTGMTYDVDTLLIAVGLSPVNELALKARQYGVPTYTAGDSQEIAEASAAMFTGRIAGREILEDLGHGVEIPPDWLELAAILKGKPGQVSDWEKPALAAGGATPVLRCVQEIPCDPCVDACQWEMINLRGGSIVGLPGFEGDCLACGRCVAICPGLAITVVDDRKGDEVNTKVVVPWEMPDGLLDVGSVVTTTDFDGNVLGRGKVLTIKKSPYRNMRKLVHLEVPRDQALDVAGIRIREPAPGTTPQSVQESLDEEIIVCRCGRVTQQQVMDYIEATDCRDLNALKAGLRVGMGACGGKTCSELVLRIFRQLGFEPADVEAGTIRPFTQEIPLSAFTGGGGS